MNIAVCAKQVPNRQDGRMDFATGLLDRKGIGVITNTYDLTAIEAGLKIKEASKPGGQVDLFTMGPPRAAAVLTEGYSVGIDRGFLISDKKFSGADVLATSYTISQAIKNTETYDLIICGKQTTDGDTGQVGAAMAVFLGMPYINSVIKIIEVTQSRITVKQKLDDLVYETRCDFPCLISVEKKLYTPRMPSLKLKIQSKNLPFTRITAASLNNIDENKIGMTGSPTRVKKVYAKKTTPRKKPVRLLADKTADYIAELIRNAGL